MGGHDVGARVSEGSVSEDELDDRRGSHAPHRLRGIEGRARLLALGMFVLLLVPFAVALVRAFHDGWIPSGDEANVATRALDVFSRHPPLTGLPSTSALYGDKIATNHPGPIEFYLLAIPVRALGLTVGPLLTAAAINAAWVLITAWVFFRRLGLTAMLWAGVLLLAVMWSGGTAVLTDTLSSNMTMYSLLCAAVLAWALLDGDLRLLPLAAFVASYAAQQHLAAGILVLALVVATGAALALQSVLRRRRGTRNGTRVTWWWWLGAFVVAGGCWTPVLIDEISGHPGNLTAIVRFARASKRPTVGLKLGVYEALHAVVPPTILARTDTTGSYLLSPAGGFRVAVGLAVVAALVACAVPALRSTSWEPALSRLALIAFVLLGAGIVSGGNVPRGQPVVVGITQAAESTRINLYRWTWAAAFVAVAVVGIGIVLLAGRVVRQPSIVQRARWLGPVALVMVAALITTAIVFVQGADDHNREQPEFALEKRIDGYVLARVDRRRPVLVGGTGDDAFLSVAPQLINRLVKAGVTVEVAPLVGSTYGNNRRYQPDLHPSSIVVTSGPAGLPYALKGTLIAIEPFGPGHTPAFQTLFDTRTRLLNQLSGEVLGQNIALSPNAQALIAHEVPAAERHLISIYLVSLSRAPRVAFLDPLFLKLVRDGLIRSPVIDQGAVHRLLDLPASRYLGAWGDEQVAVYLLNPAQTAYCQSHLCFHPG